MQAEAELDEAIAAAEATHADLVAAIGALSDAASTPPPPAPDQEEPLADLRATLTAYLFPRPEPRPPSPPLPSPGLGPGPFPIEVDGVEGNVDKCER